jgi:MFS family permease
MAALPTIDHDLGCSATSLSWAQSAYASAFGGLPLLGARADDLLGRRHAQAPFWLSASRSPRVDDRRRVVQGIGAAILAPWTLALLVHSLPEGPRGTRAMAAYGALAGSGTSVGLSSSAAR